MKALLPGVGNPGRKGTKIVVKSAWTKARKALGISDVPVPQTDTGR